MSEHHTTEVTRAGNVRYAALPKIEVPERFAGTPGVGSSLKNYMMQIRNAQYRWMKDGLEPEDFFRGLSNTVTGEAETAYGMELERMLSEPAQANGVTTAFKRKPGESLLATYGRLRELAADMECRDEWRLVSKFLNCVDERVAGDVRGRVFEMGPSATLEHAYERAKKHEIGLRLYEMERGVMHSEERRKPAWAAVATGESSSRRGPREAETRRCHRCGQEGHLQRDCSRPPRCDHCQAEGHLRRECPDLPTCENCGRRGHRTSDCYSRRPGSAGPRNKGDLEEQLRVLQARIQELEGAARKEPAMLAKEEEEGGSEAEFMLMVRAPRQRDEIDLRSDRAQRRQQPEPKVRRFRGYAAEPEQEMTSERHPKERMVCQPSVLTIEKGAITVGGVTVAQAIIDTGAHHILVGKGLAQGSDVGPSFVDHRSSQPPG
ncbi:unnamed protein product [Closterium sp. Yama58-4]|nr:unnamed protein product [Closterium sp. Yama58-4]